MNKYTELADKHSKMVNEFPMTFAFNTKQLEEAKKKLGVSSNDELLSTQAGGLIRKTDSNKLKEMRSIMAKENLEAMKDDDYLYEGFLYELRNHEYCITYDPADTFDCFGLTIEDVQSNERLLAIFIKARDQYLAGVNR